MISRFPLPFSDTTALTHRAQVYLWLFQINKTFATLDALSLTAGVNRPAAQISQAGRFLSASVST